MLDVDGWNSNVKNTHRVTGACSAGSATTGMITMRVMRDNACESNKNNKQHKISKCVSCGPVCAFILQRVIFP